MLRKLLLLLLTFFVINSYSQNERIELKGILYDLNSKPISSAHIFNKNTQKGSISNTKGEFTIRVQEGDWLQITNLLYHQKNVKVTPSNINLKSKIIYLLSLNNMLDEVEIRKKMLGFLKHDRTDTSEDTITQVKKGNLDFSNMDIKFDMSQNGNIKAQKLTDPTMKGEQASVASATIPDYALIKKRKLKKELNFKSNFPFLLKEMLGEDYFFVKLKIPKDKYHHFIDYCSYVGIEEAYKKEKYLDLLKILLKESKSYLLLLEKDK